LPVNDELVWDNGTPFPEPCIDRIAEYCWKEYSDFL
ncbi:nadh dehydrogenase [ubiquinone] 1 beta subcomplex subunit 8, partial [Quercus suber]